MAAERLARRRRRRLLVLCLFAAGALAFWSGLAFSGEGGSLRAASAAPGEGEPVAQTDDSLPASGVTLIGATPRESGVGGEADETWGVGVGHGGATVVRYGKGSGWSLGPALEKETGGKLEGFTIASSHGSALAGQMTPHGSGVLVGSAGGEEVVLVRDPNNPKSHFRATKPVPSEYLASGEKLFTGERAPLIAPLDEEGEEGHEGGALVVPVFGNKGQGEEVVLHWNDKTRQWKREPIKRPSGDKSIRVLGLGASSPENAWLLAEVETGSVALFKRVPSSGEEHEWQAAALKEVVIEGKSEEVATPIEVKKELLSIPGGASGEVQTQVLTVTSQGVWIDGERPGPHASTTVFFKLGSAGEPVSWCPVGEAGPEPCDHDLPEPLPTGPSRSIAWASSSASEPEGTRVITGLAEGKSLRLEGGAFKSVLALGGGEPNSPGNPGGAYGAAFSSPKEGWLGDQELPVHLTVHPAPHACLVREVEKGENASCLMTPWPTPAHYMLTAIASQPEAPAGSSSSEALAVGDLGEVLRYRSGSGWLPETLFGPGGRRETPRLRAVAWPTPNRAYAVGDAERGKGEPTPPMWLWRGETGLWEPDPATPVNFRGNLLGIAFEPSSSTSTTHTTRGYAVGESGALLGYGKTWVQEPYPSESPCQKSSSSRCTWANTSFTSVAFAGAEAIVAYRVLPEISTDRYEGGLIVNNGSGWHIEHAASEALAKNGSGAAPWAVAGMPDGGAAFSAGGMLYEREGSGAGWQAMTVPGAGEPGSIALFREEGALRVIASGSAPFTYKVESAAEAPPGSPPTEIKPYPLPSNEERGVLRQTASGWTDEEHELNDVKQPPGTWKFYDMVYEPDPIAAVLVDPTGGEGWAVGGRVELENKGGVLDSADIARYAAGGSTPSGSSGTSSLPFEAGKAKFAIGGNAACAAPCGDRAGARIGPDVWLETALRRAHDGGVSAFFDTGPRLPSPKAINGKKQANDTIFYGPELKRYAEVLGSEWHTNEFPTYTVATPTELPEEATNEESFRGAFSELPQAKAERCKTEPFCESAYALSWPQAGFTVRTIVLDDSVEPRSGQIAWLRGQLEAAKGKEPAIVIGNSQAGGELQETLTKNHASAYFFDSPEENVEKQLTGNGVSIPEFGSGTLGYVDSVREENPAFLGASGFMLAQVGPLEGSSQQAHVTVQLIPDIEELSLEAKDGTLLHRSQVAQFASLARRPRAGNRSLGGGVGAIPDTNLYVHIPSDCVGATCPTEGHFPEAEYTFTSSNPEIGDFVKPNLQSAEKNAIELNSEEKPIHDEHSDLFCAYNKGETTVTISAGGLKASLPVFVQAGSVRRPCGTVPHVEAAREQQQQAPAPPPPAPAPAPTSTPAGSASPAPVPLPPPPVPPAATPSASPRVVATPPLTFVPLAAPVAPLLAAVPPPLPTPARPAPPSGTSTVTQPVEAPEKEEEEEEAPESVSNKAVAYHAPDNEPSSAYLLGIVVLAAFAAASVRRRPRRGRREVRVAPATLTTMRAQRRNAPGRRQ